MTGEFGQSIDAPKRSHQTLRVLALTGISGPVLFWVVVLVLGAVTPRYSPVSDYISTLGAVGAPYAIVQRANFIVFGGSILAVAVGLHRWSPEARQPQLGLILLGVFGAGIVGAGMFQDDLMNPNSATAQLHQLVSSVAFIAALIGMPLTSWRLEQSERWPEYRCRYTGGGLAIVLLGSLVVFRVGLDTWWAGIAQRQFLLLLTGWLVFHAAMLYRLTRHPQD